MIACLGTNHKTIQVHQRTASQGGVASASKHAVLKIVARYKYEEMRKAHSSVKLDMHLSECMARNWGTFPVR